MGTIPQFAFVPIRFPYSIQFFMSELHDECGVAAIYHLPTGQRSALCPSQGPEEVSRLLPRMLLDIQNRGQLSAGMTSYNPQRHQLIDTYRELGSVSEAFRLSHQGKAESLMREYAGRAAIGHVRYATCGGDDCSYAQPFERHHLQKHKWFSFAFNGQLANYAELRDKLLAEDDHHLTRTTDTEIIMHEISRELSGDRRMSLVNVMRHLATRFDGAYSLVLLNAQGEMLIVRDPLGIKPLCYAIDGPLFAAASESVALLNLGFPSEAIKALDPGEAVMVNQKGIHFERFSDNPRRAHCFFEWIYFANVASTLDERSVYLSRKKLGEELARMEEPIAPHTENDLETVVVPVPDTSKAAADAMAYQLGIPSLEGLIRNRYSGRTFIESGNNRAKKAAIKYTPLPEILEGKRILLVEDSIVRSTTMRVLIAKIREVGKAREIHVRVACPPILAPCFYGIDMSTIGELFAPLFALHRFDSGCDEEGKTGLGAENLWLEGDEASAAIFAAMAKDIGADSVRYLPVESIARAIEKPASSLCQACITGVYPTPCGQQLYELALENYHDHSDGGEKRTYESV
jgi:amidophosphoribosyltransferase